MNAHFRLFRSRHLILPLLIIGSLTTLSGCFEGGPKVSLTRPTVTMKDGAKLAVDVILPADRQDKRVPVILIQTRYWRSFGLRVPDPPEAIPPMPREEIVAPFIKAGYGVVIADVRGTGSSEGRWPHPWSAPEVADMGTLIDWVAQQSWSDGRVGATGVSYEGTTALLAAASHHPALKAVLAREIEWSLVDELLAPGSVRNVSFSKAWGESVSALDRNQYPPLFPAGAKWIVDGVHRTDDDKDGKRLAALVAGRKVADVAAQVSTIRSGSDPFGADGPSAAEIGPSAHVARLAKSKAAIGLWGSWWDGATADGVLKASERIPVVESVIGPWVHYGDKSASPWKKGNEEKVDLTQVVAFFDRHMGSDVAPTSPRRRWFVAGAESWEEGNSWPQTQPQAWYLSPGKALSPQVPSGSGAQHLKVDFEASTGTKNRWMAGMLQPIDYGDRRQARGQIVWEAPAATESYRLFGSPLLEAQVTVDGPEAALHVYLEVREPNGKVVYLTEGVARTRGGWVSVPLRAVSYEFKRGQALRLSVAGSDRPTFERVPATGPVSFTLGDNSARQARLSIPVESARTAQLLTPPQ